MPHQALDDTRTTLNEAISSGQIPEHLHPQARTLLDQLSAPVRLAVFGPPGSGKSTLINLLLGSHVLNTADRLPTAQIKWGDTPRATCTMADGSSQTLAQFDTAEIAAKAPIFVEIELPLPALGKISVLEAVIASGSAAQALAWSDSRTDIAIWCTQNFDAAEQNQWDMASDTMKDHAFLVLTKADRLAVGDTLENKLAALKTKSADQFVQILPLATQDALAAYNRNGGIDLDGMTKSGGRTLISTILREVEQGRQAVCDRAKLFLHTNGGVENRPETAHDTKRDTLPKVTQKKPETPAPISQETANVVATAPVPTPAFTTTKWLRQPASEGVDYACAVDRLVHCGQRFSDEISTTGTFDVKQLMQETANSVQWLCDHICENGDDGDTTLVQMRDTVFDAADLMQLMFMENDRNSAANSIALVIQLKRDMEAQLAA